MKISQADQELVELARQTADRLYVRDLHEVAAALRTSSGRHFSGIHIEGSVGSVDVCGEVAAICSMVSAGEHDIDTIVAIRFDGAANYAILPPCGRCRELISDFSMNANVIVGTIEEPQRVPVSVLLPWKPGR